MRRFWDQLQSGVYGCRVPGDRVNIRMQFAALPHAFDVRRSANCNRRNPTIKITVGSFCLLQPFDQCCNGWGHMPHRSPQMPQVQPSRDCHCSRQ